MTHRLINMILELTFKKKKEQKRVSHCQSKDANKVKHNIFGFTLVKMTKSFLLRLKRRKM